MNLALLIDSLIGELALFAAAGYFLFALDDLAVDLIYFGRRGWRALVIYSRYTRAFAANLPPARHPGRLAVFIPAWDESTVIGPMLRAALRRFVHGDYRLYVGHYRNDPATGAAIAAVADPRVRAVALDLDGPTTKADCLNHLYGVM